MYKVYQPPKKTAADQVKEGIFNYVLALVLYFIIAGIAKVLITPFQILFMTDRQKFASKLARSKEKIERRIVRRQLYEEDPNNMMTQHLERKIHPENYIGEESSIYQDWFMNLKSGKLLDSDLKWAPEIYKGDGINESFLNYLSRQIKLHKGSSVGDQYRFLKTIRNFYPEFTPKYSVLISEIEGFYEKLTAKNLDKELKDVVLSGGIPEDLAEELIRDNPSSKELKEAIVAAKKILAKGYGSEMVRFCLKHNYDLDTNEALSDTINSILKHFNNEAAVLAIIRGDFELSTLNELLKDLTEVDLTNEERKDLFNGAFYKIMKDKTLKEIHT